MTQTTVPNRSTTTTAGFFWAAALACLALAIYHVATPGGPTATYVSLSDWLREATFVAFLISNLVAVSAARKHALVGAAGRLLITVGYGLILVGVSAGLVLREDPDWFFVLGGPGLLLSAAGWVTWTVWGVRRRVLPGYAAALCGVGGLVAVFGAEFGTTVLLTGFWVFVATRPTRSHAA